MVGHQTSSQGVLVLIIEGQIQPNAIYPLSTEQEIIIGRDSTCDIPLDFDHNVSRRHASIRPLKEGNWEIIDHNSANGTFINGQQLKGSQLLHPGDRLMFSQGGPEFVFEYRVPATITNEENQAQAVAPQQTIERTQYHLEIFPRMLIIQKKGVLLTNIGLVLFLIGYAIITGFAVTQWLKTIIESPSHAVKINEIYFFLVWIPLWLMVTIFCIFSPRTISYKLDLDTEQLIITSQSLIGRLFKRYRYQSYPLEEFTSVRLQKFAYEGDEGTRYNNYQIELVRQNNKVLKLDFQWRDNTSEATELIDWIQKYLESY